MPEDEWVEFWAGIWAEIIRGGRKVEFTDYGVACIRLH